MQVVKKRFRACALLILIFCCCDNASLNGMDESFDISDNAPFLYNLLFVNPAQVNMPRPSETTIVTKPISMPPILSTINTQTTSDDTEMIVKTPKTNKRKKLD